MEFSIPSGAEAPLSDFLMLSNEEVRKLIDAVRESKPALLVDSFSDAVATRSGIDARKANAIVSTFIGMYLARVSAGKSLEEFASDLTNAMREAAKGKLDASAWEKFRGSVIEILSAEESLGITAKAFDLLTDQERGLHSCRIITDVRPVFSSDPAQGPKAVVVTHLLNLVYHQIDGMKESYFGLDSSDLRSLKAAIERAEAKEASLRVALKKSEMTLLGLS